MQIPGQTRKIRSLNMQISSLIWDNHCRITASIHNNVDMKISIAFHLGMLFTKPKNISHISQALRSSQLLSHCIKWLPSLGPERNPSCCNSICARLASECWTHTEILAHPMSRCEYVGRKALHRPVILKPDVAGRTHFMLMQTWWTVSHSCTNCPLFSQHHDRIGTVLAHWRLERTMQINTKTNSIKPCTLPPKLFEESQFITCPIKSWTGPPRSANSHTDSGSSFASISHCQYTKWAAGRRSS